MKSEIVYKCRLCGHEIPEAEVADESLLGHLLRTHPDLALDLAVGLFEVRETQAPPAQGRTSTE